MRYAVDNTPQPIDWQSVWTSLIWIDHDSDENAVRQRLRQRARQYAAPKQITEAETEASLTMLAFTLGTEYYAVDVMHVRNVRNTGPITRVPGLPAFYRGVLNVRGQVITVLDLREFFDIPVEAAEAIPDELVVVRANGLEIGLLAHNIEGVQAVPQALVEPAENMRYAFGITPQRLLLLDIKHLFQDDRLLVGGKDDNDR